MSAEPQPLLPHQREAGDEGRGPGVGGDPAQPPLERQGRAAPEEVEPGAQLAHPVFMREPQGDGPLGLRRPPEGHPQRDRLALAGRAPLGADLEHRGEQPSVHVRQLVERLQGREARAHGQRVAVPAEGVGAPRAQPDVRGAHKHKGQPERRPERGRRVVGRLVACDRLDVNASDGAGAGRGPNGLPARRLIGLREDAKAPLRVVAHEREPAAVGRDGGREPAARRARYSIQRAVLQPQGVHLEEPVGFGFGVERRAEEHVLAVGRVRGGQLGDRASRQAPQRPALELQGVEVEPLAAGPEGQRGLPAVGRDGQGVDPLPPIQLEHNSTAPPREVVEEERAAPVPLVARPQRPPPVGEGRHGVDPLPVRPAPLLARAHVVGVDVVRPPERVLGGELGVDQRVPVEPGGGAARAGHQGLIACDVEAVAVKAQPPQPHRPPAVPMAVDQLVGEGRPRRAVAEPAGEAQRPGSTPLILEFSVAERLLGLLPSPALELAIRLPQGAAQDLPGGPPRERA